MTTPAQPPAEGKKKFSLTEGWGLFILILFVVFSGLLVVFAQQLGYFMNVVTNMINGFFQMIKLQQGPILVIGAAVLAYFLLKDKKKPAAAPPAGDH
jgi:hypothetical protein